MTTRQAATRALAAQTLQRVLNEGAYSNVLVSRTDAGIEIEHALYQRLVYEALRHLAGVDEAIARATPRDMDRIQAEVLSVLRIGTVEVRYLRRAQHSAVTYAVDAVRERGKPKAAGFVNGVMRSVAKTIDDPVPADAFHGFPQWLHERLEAVFGPDAVAFMVASNQPAETGIRPRRDVEIGRETGIPGARYAQRASIVELAAAGSVDVMDPASVAVANALSVQPGERVIDLAAAPGGKTRALADAAGPSGLVIACDNHARRLSTARKRSSAFDQITWVLADARNPPFIAGTFDRVLLDAPCTGLGTLRRRPEIRHRLDPSAPSAYGTLQRSLLESALLLVRPGGRLVYSVCTVFPEETVDVVSGLGGRPPDDLEGMPMGDGLLLAPHVTNTDGMFICVFDA
jgi:16S rRNA (cytosine967-C5)-methyltransferase